jgi:WD40 repeat protein/transcriptional regulator with XRE-family HTH domain
MTGDAGVFGERLRACRAAAGLSQEGLAGRSGVSVRAIRDMERGRTRWPNYESVRRLADALGLAGQEREGFLELARRPVAGPAPAPVPVTIPYRGLSAFGEQDAGLFFGREDAAGRVLELMSAALGGAGLVVVSGVSGAGKSSLLRAGVLPRLRQAGLAAAPEAAAWPALVFTPGHSPLTELAVRIAPLARADAAALRGQLTADPAGFAVTARQAALAAADAGPGFPAGTSHPASRSRLGALADGGQRRVVLVVDQCEQLFTACQDPDERLAFITALCAAAGDGAGQRPAAAVVLVTRADFEARLADFAQLTAAVRDRYLLTAMTGRQLRLAITGPAIAVGSAVEDDLVQVLLEEAFAPARGATAGAGGLPLLSHVLDQAWRTRTGTAVTLGDYERTGGIEGAVAASAQRAYQALTPAQQEVARQVFTRLTAAGADGTDTAVSAARADLTGGGGTRARDVEAVLEHFAAERLLTLDAATVAISHEVLLTAWPLLRDDWLADARGDRVTRTRLHATAAEWARAARDPAYLYTGTRLDAAAAAAARISADPRQIPFSPAARDFLAASRHASRRRARTRQQLTAVLLALIAALTTVSVTAVRADRTASAQRDIAASQRDTAVSDLLVSQSQAQDGTDPAFARKEALAAWALDPSPQARYAMIQAAANPQAATIFPGSGSVAFSPDGKTLATVDSKGARLWDVDTGRQVAVPSAEPGSGQPSSLAFSPDSKTIAVSNATGVQLWNAGTGRQAGKPFAANKTSFMVFSPDGKTLATTNGQGVQLWDLATGQQIGATLTYHDASITSMTFSPNGRILASWGKGTVLLVDVATGRQINEPFSNGGGLSAAFSPNGHTLAIGDGDGARLWNLAAGRQLGPVAGAGTGDAQAVAFSPDGAMLATGGNQGVQFWDLATGSQIGPTLTSNDGPVESLAFSPDGKALAAGTEDNTLLWKLTTAAFRQFRPPKSVPLWWSSASVVFSPDGNTLAVLDYPHVRLAGTATLWDVAASHQISKPVAITSGSPEAFVPHSSPQTLVTGIWPDGLRFWNATTGQLISSRLLAADSTLLAISPDGTMAATVSHNDHSVQVWNLATGNQTANLTKHNGLINAHSALFSPDGKTLATSSGGSVQLWNLTTGSLTATLTPRAGIYSSSSMAFSPDGKILATASDHGVQLWDLATRSPTGRLPTTIASGPVTSMAFSPDGKTLATTSGQGVQLWDLATGGQIGATLTDGSDGPIKSLAFSPDGKILATTSLSRTELWDVGYLTDTPLQLCSQAGGSFTPAEWATHLPPGTPYRNACPASANG